METVSTALYRRYRPDTFADVIGQEHVTEPLVAAIDSGRINHAYLFSGPRGCGKTTSARILARCLNCAEGPTGNPCGTCESCIELARGGSGSLDVVELDAASHGGVDDARDLRERAIFAPARDRYKIFIIDEAHMVSPQGFNALLKLVEEPPEHVKFVFATTEPEKVIGTIRSRTHHYPFRLVPPERLSEYISELSAEEKIQLDDGVIPLVVRAGGGSVRDSLSVLDQLMAGAIDGVVSYQRAVALLGYTPEGLLDDAVAALAANDGASLFGVVEQVISSGQDPRRFTEDLLERFRDLIVVLAAGEGAQSVLPHVPVDQLERMRSQASHLGAAQCSRAADLVHEALDQMVGATSPRLQLELLCARLLLPSSDEGIRSLALRLDRIEAGGIGSGGATGAAPTRDGVPDLASQAAARRASQTPPPARPEPTPPPPAQTPAPAAASAWAAAAQARAAQDQPPAPARPEPVKPAAVPQDDDGWPSVSLPGQGAAPAAPAAPAPPTEPPTPATPSDAADAGLTVQQLRNRWPEVLQQLARLRRATWALVSQDAQVVDLQPGVFTIGFSTAGLASAFQSAGHTGALAAAFQEALGLNVRIETTIVGASGRGGGPQPPPAPAPQAAPAPPRPPATPEPQATAPMQHEHATPSAEEPSEPELEPEPAAPEPPAGPPAWDSGIPPSEPPSDYDEYSPHDADVAESDLVGPPLVAKMLGGTVIDEIIEEG